MKILHNKLVRDKIPEAIQKDNKSYRIRSLSNEEYITELKKKLIEEAHEVNDAGSITDLIMELADVLEVIDAIKLNANINELELENIRKKKAKKNGKFEKKIFLEFVIEGEE